MIRTTILLHPILTIILIILFGVTSCGRKADPKPLVRYVPGAISDLKASPKNKTVLLTWSKPSKNEDGTPLKDLAGFILLRGEMPEKGDCGCEYKRIKEIDLKSPEDAVIRGNLIIYRDNDPALKYDKTYSYKVLSINKAGIISKESNEVRITLLVPPGPPKITHVDARDGSVTLRWDAPDKKIDGTPLDNLKGYNLYRRDATGVYGDEPINKGLILSRTYKDTGLKNNTKYRYILRAVNNISPPWNEGPDSEEIIAIPYDTIPPDSPKRLVTVPVEDRILVTWDESPNPDVIGYKLYRSTTKGKDYILLTPEPINRTTYTDMDVKPNVRYYYKVTAIDNAPKPNESKPSEEVEGIIRSIH